MSGPPGSKGEHRTLRVTLSRDGQRLWVRHLRHTAITIGRAPECEIVLDDAAVSWHHAEVTLGDDGITFLDRSTNGSFHRGKRVGRATLGRGGVISIPPFDLDLIMVVAEDAEFRPAETLLSTPVPLQSERGPDTDRTTFGGTTPPAPKLAAAQLRLLQAPGRLLGAVYQLGTRSVTVGRGANCDIQLDLPSVSRHHAVLTPTAEGTWHVRDAGSRNGVEVNGDLVHEAEVRFGDRIGFGTDVVATLASAAAPDTPPPAIREEPETTYSESADILRMALERSAFHSKVFVLRVSGRIDGYSYSDLREELASAIEGGHRWLIVDLTRCVYCDHTGLGVLVNTHVSLGKVKGGIRLIGLNEQLRNAFMLLRLDDVLTISADEKSAAADLARSLS